MSEIIRTRELAELLEQYRKDLLSMNALELTDEKHEEALEKRTGSLFDRQMLGVGIRMIDSILEMLEDEPDERLDGKLNRWMGFLQGVLWYAGLRSINEMRDENRPIFKRVEFAPDEKVSTEALAPYVDEVLSAVGHPEAWISDLSSVGDFAPFDEDKDEKGNPVLFRGPATESWLIAVNDKLGFEVEMDDRIYKLAEKLKEQDL